jgi:hypothetical protein
MRLEQTLNRTARGFSIRQNNRTPLLLSTRLIDNHQSSVNTKKSLKRSRAEKENILAKEIRNTSKYQIKPHRPKTPRRKN